ncbi:MAG TPA: type II secretion system F family protein [Candidatus Saccharimonadales bacterium]|nr:type II secretion system F family protein [Candidatus Saccharimonadales bacterium]
METPPKPPAHTVPKQTAPKPGAGQAHKVHPAFKEREYFAENMALLLKSAVPIGEALQSLANTAHSAAMKQGLAQMQADIEVGYSLADAMERSGMVSSQTLALVRLGEDSGHLVENLQLAAQQEEKRHTFRSKVRSALIYPSFVLGLTVIVGLGVAWFLLPRLSATFSQLHVHLPAISRFMIGSGKFLKAHGIVAVPSFFAACGLIGYMLFVYPKTKPIGQRLLLLTPGIGKLMHEVEVAQFGYLLGTLLDAGLPVTKAIRLLAKASNLFIYQDFYNYLAKSLDDGYGFKESLGHYPRSAKLLPAAVQQMIIAGEHSGSLPEVLLTIGRTYEQKSDITTSNLEAIIEPILLVIVWIGVMMVAVAVIVPIYSLVGGLNQ